MKVKWNGGSLGWEDNDSFWSPTTFWGSYSGKEKVSHVTSTGYHHLRHQFIGNYMEWTREEIILYVDGLNDED